MSPLTRPPEERSARTDRGERQIYTVGRLNREVRLLLERGLAMLWVEGEISNLAQPSSGHWYFSLKDREAQIRCAMFRQRNLHTRYTPRNGQHVLARGRVSLYEPRGDYQLIVEVLEEAGRGALRNEFERLKEKLEIEGLFAAARKRPLPRMPRRIAIVTSPTGAAIRDILHVLRRRFPAVEVLIHPTSVQGAAAAPEIVAAIDLVSARAECDLLILARGGGSLEDLWAFNDEAVARAIVRCSIPVVSGVGHEIDFTIADFVADVRAPTPSGAAEIAVPDAAAWLAALQRLEQRLTVAARRQLTDERDRLAGLRHRLRRGHPGVRLAQRTQRLDELEQRLASALERRARGARQRLAETIARLLHAAPTLRLQALCAREAALRERLAQAMRERLRRGATRLGLASRTLDAVSPLATLGRGFAIVTRAESGQLVNDAATLGVGDRVDTRLARGGFRATVMEAHGEAPPGGEGRRS